jgi:hypothetical protein
MSTRETATSGANSSTSGLESQSNNVKTNVTSTSGGGANGPSPLEQKLKKEKENYAKKAQELQNKLNEFETKAQEAQQEELVKKEQYKTLFEQEKQKADGLQAKLFERDKQVIEARKRSAVKEHLVGLGLNAEHDKAVFKLMDISSVIVDEDTGAIIGAEEAAKSFQSQYKALGFFGKQGPGVSHAAPVGKQALNSKPMSEMSMDELKDAYRKASLG